MPPPPRTKPGRSAPPPLPRRAASTARARGSVPRKPLRKPPRVEFLADELVEYDVDEVLADEFVLDDVSTDTSTDASVGFAGPSDAPPPYPAALKAASVIGSRPPQTRAGRRGRRPLVLGAITATLAVVVGLVAVGGTTKTRTMTSSGSSEAEVVVATAAPAAAPSPPAPPAEVSVALSSSDVPVSYSPSASPSVTAATAVAGVTETVQAADVRSAGAVDLKQRAQKALEKGKLTDAINLGQQAVDADPTDAESWLILGATYLQKARYKDARRCFTSCVEKATQGDVKECKALSR
jgi:hypothetical protein